jgi:(1->4)-alpha-D-glucan 1-alpha-D-glucosylmutase
VNLQQASRELSNRWPDPDIKLWVISNCLDARRESADLFAFGDYIPLIVEGAGAAHVITFARRLEDEVAIVCVPRLFHLLLDRNADTTTHSGPPRPNWTDTRIVLPDEFPNAWQCKLSGQDFESNGIGSKRTLSVAELLNVLPVAVLKSS